MTSQQMRCDLFCTVIDNYGDLGVCWRLSRQLASEHGVSVTLWVDDLASLAQLAPALDPSCNDQMLGAIRVRRWQPGSDMTCADCTPADLVIEGFACRLPDDYLQAMAVRTPVPVWINLEYLSAETWVEDCHGMASVHPRNGLTQHFLFPGFSARTGGLLREAGLSEALDHLRADHTAATVFWQRIGVPEAGTATRRISLFSYENPAAAGLLDALAADDSPTQLLAFAGRGLAGVNAWLDEALAAGDNARRGNLHIHVLPLLDHADYDRVLALCDLNLVRGEDSFVRAQWVGQPLLWHIYPQDEQAHAIKLDAFIARVEVACAMPAAWVEAMRQWNQLGPQAGSDWPALLATLPDVQAATRTWRRHLLAQNDLATQLMRFYTDRVESPPVQYHLGTHTR